MNNVYTFVSCSGAKYASACSMRPYMGISERKEREREEMRGKILQAAAFLFVRDGFEKTTIRSIAAHIEYSPGTIYLYFKDKAEIMSALFGTLFKDFAQKLRDVSSHADPKHAVLEVGLNYLDFALANPMHYELMFMMDHRQRGAEPAQEPDASDCDSPAGLAADEGFNYLMQSLQAAQQAGRNLRFDLHTSTLTAWAGVHGVVSLYLRGFLDAYPEELRKQVMRNTIQSLEGAIFQD